MKKPFAIYYEHPDWFKPLFAELERRGVAYERVNASESMYDPASNAEAGKYSLFFNRMSPSAYLRGAGQAILYTQGYLSHLEAQGLRVVNGSGACRIEVSKGQQLQLLHHLGLPYPKAVVINHASRAVEAASRMRFPVVVKANIGGSGAGIVRYDTCDQLRDAITNGEIDLGLDSTALVQEFIPARDGRITRVETLGGRFLYAINVYSSGDSFNLCPADICQTTSGVELTRSACPIDAPRSGIKVEAALPPIHVIEAIELIVQKAQIDVGGIEYMVDDRDGAILYYDINALSNFVADAINVIGFDPFERLVDFLIVEAA